MSTAVLPMSSPGPKRSFEATIEPSMDFSPSTVIAPDAMAPPPAEMTTIKADSNTRESTPLSSVPDHVSTNPSSPPSGMQSVPNGQAPAKKRKLTFAEREVIRIEREFKAQQKEEEKLKREEEKRAKAEEQDQKKRLREIEREEKRKQQEDVKEEKRKMKEAKDAAKEAELAARDAERKTKEEEKAKKERSQLRLNAFFVAKGPHPTSATSSRRSSIASLKEGSPAKPQDAAVVEKPEGTVSTYDKMFPNFFIHTHTLLAPVHRYDCDAASLEHACSKIEEGVRQQCQEVGSVSSLKRALEDSSFEPLVKRRKLGSCIIPVKQIVSKMNGTEDAPVDLTGSEQNQVHNTFKTLNHIPVKYLRYAEDVRPPYIGTYTKTPTSHSVAKLCRNPFTRALPKVNYDYDSEAEWEEPEEGEDLNSDDDEEDVEDEGDDMDGFLDDEGDTAAAPKRRNVMGDMDPVCTPLFWQTCSIRQSPADVSYGSGILDLAQFRIAPLLEVAKGPIDPLSTIYWAPAAPPAAASLPAASADATAATMAPPPLPSGASRVPLTTLHGPNTAPVPIDALATLGSKLGPQAGVPKAKAAAKPFPTELLGDFKKAIEGSDLSKIGLVEVLKKKFPQVTGKTVGETLGQVARREGKNVADKKWVLI